MNCPGPSRFHGRFEMAGRKTSRMPSLCRARIVFLAKARQPGRRRAPAEKLARRRFERKYGRQVRALAASSMHPLENAPMTDMHTIEGADRGDAAAANTGGGRSGRRIKAHRTGIHPATVKQGADYTAAGTAVMRSGRPQPDREQGTRHKSMTPPTTAAASHRQRVQTSTSSQAVTGGTKFASIRHDTARDADLQQEASPAGLRRQTSSSTQCARQQAGIQKRRTMSQRRVPACGPGQPARTQGTTIATFRSMLATSAIMPIRTGVTVSWRAK